MHEFLRYVKLYTECDDYAIKRLEPLLEKYIQPKVIIKEKKMYVDRETSKPTITIQEFFAQYSELNNITYDDLIKRTRSHEVLIIRNTFIRIAFQYGYGYSLIGRFLKKDHTTIINVIKKSKL